MERFKIFFFLIFPLSTIGQKIYSGTIVNKAHGEKIPYATIGLVKENIGINADEQGHFRISSNNFNDSLRISSVEYHTLIIALSDLSDNMILALEERQTTLKDVVISNNRINHISLNKFTNCSFDTYHATLRSINQLAKHFEAPEVNMQLSEITICKEGSASLFRLRIYGIDSISGKPLTDLTNKIIEVKSSQRRVKINLEEYNIFIPTKDFFIAIEWIFVSSNTFRLKGKINGNKFNYNGYYPGIAFKKRNNSDGNNDVWLLQFNGKWMRPFPVHRHMNFLISANLKY